MPVIEKYLVTSEESGARLGVFVAGAGPGLSRSYAQKLIGEGLVRVTGGGTVTDTSSPSRSR